MASIGDRLVDFGFEDVVLADGFDSAIIGVVERCGQEPFVVYDMDKCIDVLVLGGMAYDNAVEYFAFNTLGAHAGETSPGYITLRLDDGGE